MTLAYNLPHFIYHLTSLGMYAPIDQAGNVVALGAALLASIVLLVAPPGRTVQDPAP